MEPITITITSKKQFAQLIMEHPIWDKEGNKYYFNEICANPFRVLPKDGKLSNNMDGADAWNACMDETVTKTPPLQDKQPVRAWGNNMKFEKVMGFYDAKNKCSFTHNEGKRGGCIYDNYEPIPELEIPRWMKEKQKDLED